MKETNDTKSDQGEYQRGDLVWLYKLQQCRSLSLNPVRINDVIYRIKKFPGGNQESVSLTVYAYMPVAMKLDPVKREAGILERPNESFELPFMVPFKNNTDGY